VPTGGRTYTTTSNLATSSRYIKELFIVIPCISAMKKRISCGPAPQNSCIRDVLKRRCAKRLSSRIYKCDRNGIAKERKLSSEPWRHPEQSQRFVRSSPQLPYEINQNLSGANSMRNQ
jgi:hypothetical protein